MAFEKRTMKNGTYYGDYSNGHITGSGVFINNTGVIYSGQFSDGHYDGQGVWLLSDGRKYYGRFSKSKVTGKGILFDKAGNCRFCGTWTEGKKSTPSGDHEMKTIEYTNGKFHGSVVGGKRTGPGTMVWDSGDRYEGDFLNDERTGTGKYFWASGSRYEGTVLNGSHTGKGKYFWVNGDRYEGDFLNDERTGKGKLFWASGSRYEGDFLNGKFAGKGKLFWADGSRYEGDFLNDERTGKGKLFLADGSRYEGDFLNGKRHGQGCMYDSNGRILFSGQWKNVEKCVSVRQNIPEKYKNHVMLRGIGGGFCNCLRGRVAIVARYVSCKDKKWTKSEKEQFRKEFRRAGARLEKEAVNEGIPLKITLLEYPEEYSLDIDSGGKKKELGEAAQDRMLSHIQEENLPEYKKKFSKDKPFDEIAWVFVFNINKRSYANVYASVTSRLESCVLFSDGLIRKFSDETIMHELLHLFGAEDYYLDVTSAHATKYLGRSIMKDSGCYRIDDLTKFCIGWSDVLSENAKRYLDATAHITEKMFDEARKKDTTEM